MTGWEKVIAATVVAVIGLMGLNLAIWRRLKQTANSGDGAAGLSDARSGD